MEIIDIFILNWYNLSNHEKGRSNLCSEPDLYIANSSVVARRIQENYGKQAIVINYPIDSSNLIFFRKKDNFYLASLG